MSVNGREKEEPCALWQPGKGVILAVGLEQAGGLADDLVGRVACEDRGCLVHRQVLQLCSSDEDPLADNSEDLPVDRQKTSPALHLRCVSLCSYRANSPNRTTA